MEGTAKRPWSDLPPEILSMIGTRLHTRMDVLRFRSVCASFRSSTHLPRRDPPRFPFQIPHLQGHDLFLHKSTVYTLDTPADGATSGGVRWLLKLEELELGDMRILSLFSTRPMVSLPPNFPEVLDSRQLVEIGREYTLECGARVQGMLRVVVHPDCAGTDLDQCSVYFIDKRRQLWYWEYGDDDWSHLGCGHDYEDIVVYQGKVCVVDKLGSVSQIDSSFRLQSFSPPIDCGCGCPCRHFKRLVVSSGDLYAVDICFRLGEIMKTPDFRLYRLDQQRGRWEEVRSLGNSAFFLCKFCSFAISAGELGGCDGNCIYYASDAAFPREQVKAFNLADHSHKYLDSEFSGLFQL